VEFLQHTISVFHKLILAFKYLFVGLTLENRNSSRTIKDTVFVLFKYFASTRMTGQLRHRRVTTVLQNSRECLDADALLSVSTVTTSWGQLECSRFGCTRIAKKQLQRHNSCLRIQSIYSQSVILTLAINDDTNGNINEQHRTVPLPETGCRVEYTYSLLLIR
jgi:hypothetical protein